MGVRSLGIFSLTWPQTGTKPAGQDSSRDLRNENRRGLSSAPRVRWATMEFQPRYCAYVESATYRTLLALASEMLSSVRGRLAGVLLALNRKLAAPDHQH